MLRREITYQVVWMQIMSASKKCHDRITDKMQFKIMKVCSPSNTTMAYYIPVKAALLHAALPSLPAQWRPPWNLQGADSHKHNQNGCIYTPHEAQSIVLTSTNLKTCLLRHLTIPFMHKD